MQNFLWQREDEPQNMLSYLFLVVNLTYGIAFTFFSYTAPVTASIINAAFFPGWIWGLACLFIVGLTLWSIAFRSRRLGTTIAYPAMAVWGYGFVLSTLEFQLLAAFAVYLPQIMFWLFWHVGVVRFYAKEDRLKLKRETRAFIDNKD